MNSTYNACIEACLQCASASNHCASACLREKEIGMMAQCIQLCMESSTICSCTVQLMHLQSDHANSARRLCGEICISCAEECEKHDMEHCRMCAEACRHCAEECMALVAA